MLEKHRGFTDTAVISQAVLPGPWCVAEGMKVSGINAQGRKNHLKETGKSWAQEKVQADVGGENPGTLTQGQRWK